MRKTIYILFLSLYSLSSFANPEMSKRINEFLESKSKSIARLIQTRNVNEQDFSYQEIVLQAEAALDSEWMNQQVNGNHLLEQYRNLMRNHLLHIQLSNKIEAFENLSLMYPHEMPFKHSGQFPSLPSYQALEKVGEFFGYIENPQSIVGFDFTGERLRKAQVFLDSLDISSLNQVVSQLRKFENSGLDNSLSDSALFVDFKKSLSQKPSLVLWVLKLMDSKFSEKEQSLIRTIESAPLDSYHDYRGRILNGGLNTSFKNEFSALVKKVELAASSAPNVEQAVKTNPILARMHRATLARLRSLIHQGNYGYREVWDELVRASEFFDLVERSEGPHKSNPLHYAKRYEYYLHTVLGWAPDHISIPSSAHLKTFDLLSVSGVPIGFGGVATDSLWVDSYLQTPNEFLLHDVANHERRRYQFTRNYFFRLGIPEREFPKMYANVNNFLRTTVLPIIRRINRFESTDKEFVNRAELLNYFQSNTPGAYAYEKEINGLVAESQTNNDYKALNNKYRVMINRKKTLYDMILFEIVHEDALPPTPWAIIESIMRPPNLPMPRDFIDIDNKTAHHTMEPAGTTMAYILQKLNGSFYDTPEKRMLAVSAPEYRTPKSIIKATAELVELLGGYPGMTQSEVLQQIVFLTLTEEGFLTYLTEEFQRDLHPIQKELLRSLKYSEGLEVLSLINEFNPDTEFKHFMSMLRDRIKLSQGLSLKSNPAEVEKVLQEFAELDRANNYNFNQAREYYFKLATDLNERIFYRVNESQSKRFNISGESLQNVESRIAKSSIEADRLRQVLLRDDTSQAFKNLEKVVLEIEDLKQKAIKLRRASYIGDFIRQNKAQWENLEITKAQRQRLAGILATDFHDRSWRPNFRMMYGVKAHYRDVPASAIMLGEDASAFRLRLENEGFIGLRINAEGRVQQNINLPSSKLIPELFYELNIRIAEQYVDLILEAMATGKALDRELIEDLSDKVHHLWMKNNVTKVKTALKKMGVRSNNPGEIMDVVSNMKLQDWEALNIDELRAMRQYRPKDKLSSRELSNDRSMVLSVMNNLFESTYIEDLAKRIRTDWNSIDPVNLDIERLSFDLAYQMHRTWLRNHRLVAPREKRVRSIPLENFKGEDVERIRRKLKDASYKGLLIDPVKGLSQDINQEPEKLVPQLLEQMNGNLARAYIEQVLAMRASGVDFGPDVLSLLSANVHDLWMEQNKWQVSGILKKLGYDYRRLDVKQIIQIFHQLEKSQWLLMAPNEVEKIYQFSVTEKLSWKDHKRNVDMMALSIQFLANPNSCIRSAN